MKAIIFAGGTGRRLWPISRQASPKQFEPIVGEKSTLRLAVDRILALSAPEDIFVSTNERYLEIIGRQLPELPAENLIGEPARRDLAAAVGLALTHLDKRGDRDEVVGIFWGDNTMSDAATFQRIVRAADRLIAGDRGDIVFIGETPRFANENLGWIGLGPQLGEIEERPYYAFNSLTYQPAPSRCQEMLAAGSHVWNTGYFVTRLGFLASAYERHQPAMWAGLQAIGASIGSPTYPERLRAIYPTLEEIHFDNAILTHLSSARGLVVHGEMGWGDPGTLYALKEFLQDEPGANVSRGLVRFLDTTDALLYNYQPEKLLVAIGLEGLIVVNTEDAILVVHKDHIPQVKQLVDGLTGTELERFS